MSGGPGDGATDEPTAMARLAQELGVSRESIILDRAGLTTRASITNTAAICRDQRLSRVLAVSHFYHLPRIKLEASRADLDLCTVPAPQARGAPPSASCPGSWPGKQPRGGRTGPAGAPRYARRDPRQARLL